MKRKLLTALGAVLIGALAYGAVKTYIIDPKTVTSAEDILELFYETRNSIPPLPSPINYLEVVDQLKEGRLDFIASPNWAYTHDGGTFYLADKSKLGRKLELPATLLAYEDLASGKVVVAGIPESTKELQSLLIVDAPEFSPFEGVVSVDSYLMEEIWPRRVVWTATLKPEEDAWNDLVQTEQATTMSVAPMMMAMSAPEEITLFEVIQDGTNISVNLPNEFVGADITLERSTNLVTGGWADVFQTNALYGGTMFLTYAELPVVPGEMVITTNTANTVDPITGETNYIAGTVTTNYLSPNVAAFYRAYASSSVDTDGDGLDNVSEYGAGTDYLWKDSSGDGLWDGWLVQHGFDPLGLNTLGDGDNDGLSNLEEQKLGTDPDSANSSGDTGTVATMRYYYDEDDRMTDFYCGAEVAQKTTLSASHNISEEVSAK